LQGLALAQSINNLGQAVGYSRNGLSGPSGRGTAEFWSSSQVVTHLGSLGGNYSFAADINDAGQIVGSSYLPGTTNSHATLWNVGAYGTAIDLGTLGGASSSALAMNGSGTIVGQSTTGAGSFHAALWRANAIVDLNNLLDPAAVSAGWVLSSANNINDNGVVVGQAFNSLSGANVGNVLTAVPEPRTMTLMLFGMLGLLPVFKKRRADGI
jgi:probable HAF family extracellular repeat protein